MCGGAGWGAGLPSGCDLGWARESGVVGDVGRVLRRTGRGGPENSLTLSLDLLSDLSEELGHFAPGVYN